MAYAQCITGVSPIYVTAGYPYYSDGSAHGGIDTVHVDHNAYAPTAGSVITAQTWDGSTITGNQSWGNMIIVQFAENQYWLAAHFASQIHKVGDTLAQGQFIGVQGATGNVTGIHTHWEYWNGGASTSYRADPSGILRIPNAVGTYETTWDADTPPTPGEYIPVWMLFKFYNKRR